MSTILNRTFIKREIFDPKNEAHMASFDHFVKTGNWGDVQFFAELPYAEAPITVLMKHAEFIRGVQRETVAERTARFATMQLVKPTPVETREEKLARFEAAHQMVLAAA